jgi:hypothetical protein
MSKVATSEHEEPYGSPFEAPGVGGKTSSKTQEVPFSGGGTP